MVSSEDVLMEFNATDNISSVVSTIESNVLSSIDAITSSISDIEAAFDSVSRSADMLDVAFSSFSSSSSDLDSVNTDMENIGKSADDTSSSLEYASGNASTLNDNLSINTTSLEQATEDADRLGDSLNNIQTPSIETPDLGIDESAVNSAVYFELANAMNSYGSSAESMARDIDEANITIGQLATQTGIAEPELANLVTYISNVTFPNDEAMMYIKSLDQIGVSSSNFADSATNLDKINDAFGLGATTVNSLGQELSVLGVDMNNISSAFNALAYANSNTVGGMQNYYTFLRKYDAEFKEFGFNVDQASVIIAGATKKYGGGRAALSGLNEALKESGGNAKLLEQALDLSSGSISNATSLTAQYEGQLQTLADEEMEHKTITERLGAVWEDFTLKYGEGIETLGSVVGGIGQIGNFGLAVMGLKELTTTFKGLGKELPGVLSKMKQFKGMNKLLGSGASGAAASIPNVGNTGKAAKTTTTIVKDASVVGGLAPEATAAAGGVEATGGALSGISAAFTSMIVPLLAIAAVIAVMIPIIVGLAAEALIFLKGIQLLIDALDFDSIDLTSTIEAIKQIGQALLEMGIAMGEMAFSNVMTGIAVLTSGITGLINPVQVAGSLLIKASEELQVFNSVNIDKSVPANIKKISDSLKAVSEAMFSLTNVVLSMAAGNILTLGGLLGDVNTAIRTAKEELTYAAREISTIKDLPDIPDDSVKKLEKISSSLESVSKAFEALRSLRDDYNWDTMFDGIRDLFGGVDIQSALVSAKDDIYKAAESLRIFKDISDVPDGVSEKLKKVADSLGSVSESISSLRKLRDDYNWDSSWGSIFGGTDIVGVMNSLKDDLYKVAASLSSLNDISSIPEGTGDKIQRVSWTLNNVLTAINSLKNVQDNINGGLLGGGLNLNGVISIINTATSIIMQVSSRLASMGNMASIPDGTGNNIQRITWTLNNMGSAVNSMNAVPSVGEGVVQRVTTAVTTVNSVASQLNRLSGASVGDVGGILSAINNVLNQMKATLNNASSGLQSSGVNIGNSIKSGVNQGLSNLNSIMVNRVNVASGAAASAGWTGGARMGASMSNGFKSAFNIHSIVSGEMSNIVTAIKTGSPQVVSAMGQVAKDMVTQFRNDAGVNSPGHIANTMRDEMGYTQDYIKYYASKPIGAISDVANSIVNAFNPNLSNVGWGISNPLDYNSINALNTMTSNNTSTGNVGNGQVINFNFSEGAFKLDAHNLTTTEAQQVVLNVLESMQGIKRVETSI